MQTAVLRVWRSASGCGREKPGRRPPPWASSTLVSKQMSWNGKVDNGALLRHCNNEAVHLTTRTTRSSADAASLALPPLLRPLRVVVRLCKHERFELGGDECRVLRAVHEACGGERRETLRWEEGGRQSRSAVARRGWPCGASDDECRDSIRRQGARGPGQLTLDRAKRAHLLEQPDLDILALAASADKQVAEEDGLRVR